LVNVENSIVLLRALRRANVSVEAHFFAQGEHGFFLLPRNRWQGKFMDWLVENRWLTPRH
jgi:hypothetical protein